MKYFLETYHRQTAYELGQATRSFPSEEGSLGSSHDLLHGCTIFSVGAGNLPKLTELKNDATGFGSSPKGDSGSGEGDLEVAEE